MLIRIYVLHPQTAAVETKFFQGYFNKQRYEMIAPLVSMPLSPTVSSLYAISKSIMQNMDQILGFAKADQMNLEHSKAKHSGVLSITNNLSSKVISDPPATDSDEKPRGNSFRQSLFDESATNFFYLSKKFTTSINDTSKGRVRKSKFFGIASGLKVGFNIKELRKLINQPAEFSHAIRSAPMRLLK